MAVLGEDLAAAALRHCLLSNVDTRVNVRSEPVTTVKPRGPRLHRWIEADLADGRMVLFQTEIKSRSAHAIGERTLSLPAPADAVETYKQKHRAGLWDGESRTLGRPDVAKGLMHMKPRPQP